MPWTRASLISILLMPGPVLAQEPAGDGAQEDVAVALVPPMVTVLVAPARPTDAWGAATVELRLVVDVHGFVDDATVLQSAGAPYDQLAHDAVSQWRFSPALQDGLPVAAEVRVSVPFADLEPVAPTEAVMAAPPTDEDEDDRYGAEVTVDAAPLRAGERGASDTTLERDVLEAAPHAEGADVLRAAPGVYIARPEGDAVAHRIALRGFDADHGQDIELRVAGLPINLPSHIHGQGYADLGFLMSEVIDSVRVTEGVFDPAQGDFAVAGTIELELGATRRGLQSRSSYGSFGTFRQSVVWAPAGLDQGTFAAFQFRRSDGFGQNRDGMGGSAIVQHAFAGSGGWRHRLVAIAHAARYRLAGVVRQDDHDTVGFYDVYPQATARAQNALSARVLAGYEATHRAADGSTSQLTLWAGYDDFRLQENFTGFIQRSTFDPDWVGRGDLIEQTNETTSVGLRAHHRTKPYELLSWLDARLEVGLQTRLDRIGQAQNLIQAPQNETWDRRVDARIGAADIGVFGGVELDATEVLSIRVGARADLLTYEVDDRLGNFIPEFRRDSYIVGYRRSALGVAAGPRTSVVVRPLSWLSILAGYGEGYRSPQARTLEDGESAPFTKVRSADAGVRFEAGERLTVRATGYWTRLSDDVAFDPRDGRLERVGATRRAGGVLHVEARPLPGLVASGSATYVDAELLEPPPASAADPQPPFQAGQSLPYVPPWVLRLDVGGHRELARLKDLPVEGRIGVGYSFLSPRPLPNALFASRVSLFDASAGVSWGPVGLSLDVFNLFDQRYAAVEYAFASHWDPDAPRSRLPARHTSAGSPRTVMLTLEVRL